MSFDCWEWNGARDKDGYGTRHFRGRKQRLSRVAYEWANGPIPSGTLVRHKCDNPPCVNPDHLELGTQLDNMRDRLERKRHPMFSITHCPRGHEYTNRDRTSRGDRRCLTCHRERERARRNTGV